MSDKGDHSTWQKEKKQCEKSNMNAILAELRLHHDEFKKLKSQNSSQKTD